MDVVNAVQVDERDNRWEDDRPRFRVYLHGSGETSTGGWTDTYDVTGADLLQVLDWAQRQAGDRLTYAIALVRDDPGHGRGLVWLVGRDGNGTPTHGSEADALRRMLLRRTTPVGIGEFDQMPSGVLDPYADGTG
jgi:hypothetical protein